jgi:hypothetical protein
MRLLKVGDSTCNMKRKELGAAPALAGRLLKPGCATLRYIAVLSAELQMPTALPRTSGAHPLQVAAEPFEMKRPKRSNRPKRKKDTIARNRTEC